MRKFIITIDTEGDNLWQWKKGEVINTENIKYLPRFQNLAEDYGFKPVWLSNYEMISNNEFLKFICDVESRKTGELGMHLHAWNNPPYYPLDQVRDSQPYLIEYPEEIMDQKISSITDLIFKETGIRPISHRAGRWATDKRYFALLVKYGYKIDCSYTPHVNWKHSLGCTKGGIGSDYSKVSENPVFIDLDGEKGILEMPMTVRVTHDFSLSKINSVHGMASELYHAMFGRVNWLRPNGHNLVNMLDIIESESTNDYVMFMIHSSELMPGGSPTFKNSESIESLYRDLDVLFKRASNKFKGCTLREYYSNWKGI